MHPQISTPTLLLDEVKCRENIANMAEKARRHKLLFRPHFKTHQSLEVGTWFREKGVTSITVSSLSMASYFAEQWNDITVAFPVNILEIDTINRLASCIRLGLLVESMESLHHLQNKLDHKVAIWIKIDVGYHRTGVRPDDHNRINALIQSAKSHPMTHFKGFLGHAGHSYQCQGREAVLKIHQESLAVMQVLKSKHPESLISLGDTPTCSVAEDFEGVDEIRPGNFVFYDLVQHHIGSCAVEQIAVHMACPIVAVHPDRQELVVHGGAVHFSKDQHPDGSFGWVIDRDGKPISGMKLSKISQEHGTISVPQEWIENYKIGDMVFILPVHSCLTANLQSEYKKLEGDFWIKRFRL